MATNPITPEGEFLSDPAPRTGPDGALYVFGSRDERTAGGAYCTHFNDAFSVRLVGHAVEDAPFSVVEYRVGRVERRVRRGHAVVLAR